MGANANSAALEPRNVNEFHTHEVVVPKQHAVDFTRNRLGSAMSCKVKNSAVGSTVNAFTLKPHYVNEYMEHEVAFDKRSQLLCSITGKPVLNTYNSGASAAAIRGKVVSAFVPPPHISNRK